MKKSTEFGSSLLELLMVLGVFMALLPFVYNLAMNKKDQIENNLIAQKIRTVKTALEQYVYDNRQTLLAPVSANVVKVKMSDLKNITDEDLLNNKNIQLRVVKSKDIGGRAFVQGVVIFDQDNITPLRTRQIAIQSGENAGFADGTMLYGAFGTWQTQMANIRSSVGSNSIIYGTKPIVMSGNYIERLPSDNDAGSIMKSDLNMGGYGIEGAKSIGATSAKFLTTLSSDSIESSSMTVKNRLSWDTGIEVLGDTTVDGAITSDYRDIKSTNFSVTGTSQFKSVATDNLSVDNLYLSGFSVVADASEPTILTISGSMDMIQGHIKAIDTFVGFSGSVAPKLEISKKIEDGQNANYYWDLANNDAVFMDLQLATLSTLASKSYTNERTGDTQTEVIFRNVVQNSNATVSDYIKAIAQIKQKVAAKYNEIKN